MQRLNKFVAGLGLAAILAAGSANVFAKSDTSKPRFVSGSIVSIDRGSRTLVVRDSAADREIYVRVPERVLVKTNAYSGASVSFELLLKGMSVRELAVE